MKQKAMYHLVFTAAVAAMVVAGMPLYASETDGKIESSFKQTYAFKTILKDDAVRIDVKEGVVTLNGQVGEASHKYLAQEAVAGLPGVQKVDNRLVVKLEGTEKSDSWIKAKVRSVLALHRNVSGSNTQVDIKDGVVTLRGVATSEAQKELATEYANDIEDVKEVKNEMTMEKAPEPTKQTVIEKMDDISITAQIKTALWIHRSTSATKTKVETKNGEVTLSGAAKNVAEKTLVTKLVNDIHGVTSVKNEMTIEAEKSK